MTSQFFMNNTFNYLISPLTRERFFKDYFEKRHIHIKSSHSNRFDRILSEENIEQVLTYQRLTLPNTRMAHKDANLDSNTLTLEGTKIIDITKVIENYSEGATLVLSQLQDKIKTLKDLCDELSKDFGQRFQTNIYCTPNNNSQGFNIHHDTHDVYILQITGEKVWRIYDSPLCLAIKDLQFDKEVHKPGEIIDEFTLKPGDLLYIPRGLMHSARTINKKSIHVTIGCTGYTLQDLLINQVNRLCQSNPDLRRGFEPNFWNEPDKYLKLCSEAFSLCAKKEEVQIGLNQLYQKNINRYRINVESPIKQAEAINEINLLTKIVLKKSTPYYIELSSDGNFSITLFNKEISLSMDYYPLIEFIIDKQTLVIDDLPLLDNDGKIEFIKLLLKSGFLITI